MNQEQQGCCHHHSSKKPGRPVGEADVYICPMHPEIRQTSPGHCPLCGMALEPETASLDDSADPEYAYMLKRFWWALGLTLPLFIMAMSGSLVFSWLAKDESLWLQFLLATPVVFYCGWPFLLRGWQSFKSGQLNMFSLISIGISVTWTYSSLAVFFPELFPERFITAQGTIDVYFEAAAVITTLVLLGQVLELKARSKTGNAIRALLSLAPELAHRLNDQGQSEDIPLSEVAVGDRLRVKPGEKLPVDGKIVEGETYIDESMISGEPMAQKKGVGDKVIGATLNQRGSFIMEAEYLGEDSMLARIVKLVAEAQRSRAAIQRIADRVAGIFVPIVIVVALAALVLWGLFGPPPAFSYGLIAAVSVLMIACPCALGLATPMSIMVGIGKAASAGILIKNADVLEKMEKLSTIVLDKTGTLTQGQPELTEIFLFNQQDKLEILGYAAALEQHSEHPLAIAILEQAKKEKLSIAAVEDFESFTGEGVFATMEAKRLLIGNERLMQRFEIDISQTIDKIEAMRESGATVLFFAIEGQVAALFSIEDPIKESARAAIDFLQSKGIELIMLTGDSKKTASAVAVRLGIQQVIAEVLPEDKEDVIRQLQGKDKLVAMAGDGVNDAPALARADLGIAMGSGSDVALESADVTLLHGDLSGLVKAYYLSQMTMRNIRQNLFFAFIYNALGVPVAAGLFYPFFGILLNPMIAAAAMSLSSVSVIVNALRLNWQRLPKI